MKNKKLNWKEFTLISEKTKQRIKGLIEKRLTAQTVALFAQEYEDYDVEVRTEIIEFIAFLLDEEQKTIQVAATKAVTDPRAKMFEERKRLELQEKQANIRKIQDYLMADKSKGSSSIKKPNQPDLLIKDLKSPLVSMSAPVKKAESKPVVKKETVSKKPAAKSAPVNRPSEKAKNDKLEQMLKEARLREAREAKLEQERQEQLAKEKAERAKQKELAAKQKAKEKAAAKKTTTSIAKKTVTKSNDTKKVINKSTTVSKQERDYAKEQAEKERLWRELYGKTRDDSLKERTKTSVVEVKPVDVDKTPTIHEVKITHFSLFGQRIDIAEITDPKNKYYLFWGTMKTKFKMGNVTAWLKSQKPKMHKKVYKKRKKFEKKLLKKLNQKQATKVEKVKNIDNKQEKVNTKDNKMKQEQKVEQQSKDE